MGGGLLQRGGGDHLQRGGGRSSAERLGEIICGEVGGGLLSETPVQVAFSFFC